MFSRDATSATKWLATIVSILIHGLHVQARDMNLTLTFSDPSQTAGQCSQNGSDDSITFSSQFSDALVLIGSHACLNLDEIYTSNATYQNTSWSTHDSERIGISYSLYDKSNYDPSANYSSVLYHQLGTGPEDESSDSNQHAMLRLILYSGKDCSQNGGGETLDPWIAYTCRASGDCSKLSFGVASFAIMANQEAQNGKCVLSAVYGSGSSLRPGLTLSSLAAVAIVFFALL